MMARKLNICLKFVKMFSFLKSGLSGFQVNNRPTCKILARMPNTIAMI